MTMHILQVAAHLPPRYQGGAEIHTAHLIDALVHQCERVTVFHIGEMNRKGGPAAAERRYRQHGADYISLSLHDGRLDPPQHYFHQPDVAAHLSATLRRIRPDIVHIQGGFRLSGAALATALAHQQPVVVTLHDYYYLCPRVNLWTATGKVCASSHQGADCPACVSTPCVESGDLMEDWMAGAGYGLAAQLAAGRRYLRRTLQRAHHLLAPSLCLADTYVQRGGIDSTRLSVHRLGLPSALRRRERREISRGVLRVGYIGHLRPHKGLSTLLRALRRLDTLGSAVQLTIHGVCEDTMDYVQRLQQQAKGLTTVTFAAAYPNDGLPALLSQTDVVVVPSLWPENAPLVVSSALRLGVPVIASRIGGLSEMIVDGGNGLLFEPGDDRALAACLAELIHNPVHLRELATQSRYDWTTEQEVDGLRALYRALCHRHARGGWR